MTDDVCLNRNNYIVLTTGWYNYMMDVVSQ